MIDDQIFSIHMENQAVLLLYNLLTCVVVYSKLYHVNVNSYAGCYPTNVD